MELAEKLKSILSNLGKSTLRGVKKCPKCGTYNGTRGISCKNKNCDAVFRTIGEKRKVTIDAAKLDTGKSTRVFSVRVRDKGPDYRGFVQLPLVASDNSDPTDYLTENLSSLCFVDSCQRLFNANILKCHERQMIPSVTTCPHILLAMKCSVDAYVFKIDFDALQTLDVSQDIKDAIWLMSNESPGPLVQRVSKHVMAVKCKVTTTDPLGFLHVSFFPEKKYKESHSICTCSGTTSRVSAKKNATCIHYYSCIAAFASDSKCSEEFSNFLAKERISEDSYSITITEHEPEDDDEPLYAVLSQSIDDDIVGVEVLQKDLLLHDITHGLDGLSSVDEMAQEINDSISLDPIKTIDSKKKSSSKGFPIRKSIEKKKNKPKLPGNLRKQLADVAVDESKTQTSFVEWLASVTERINQSMHYQFDGKPDALVFYTSHSFFDCLLDRIMNYCGGSTKRRRLPNKVTTFIRRNTPPVGEFNNYVWNITNVLHAKAIFDTHIIALDVFRSFIRKNDGTYVDFDPGDLDLSVYKKGQPALRPTVYKTYLKIGNTSPDQEVPSALVISWTPCVLPVSKMGELKITFEYGHTQHPLQNGATHVKNCLIMANEK